MQKNKRRKDKIRKRMQRKQGEYSADRKRRRKTVYNRKTGMYEKITLK